VSKGCIRLYNQDVLDLYPRVNVGAKVTVTYKTFTTSGGAVASKAAPIPSKGMTGGYSNSGYNNSGGKRDMDGGKGNSSGSPFDLFSDEDDDPPPVKTRPRSTKTKVMPKSSATREKSAAFSE
jgi:hypothetical protein